VVRLSKNLWILAGLASPAPGAMSQTLMNRNIGTTRLASAIGQRWNLNGDLSFAHAIERAYSNSGYSAVIRQELNHFLQERAAMTQRGIDHDGEVVVEVL
jgi:hypothetical protein